MKKSSIFSVFALLLLISFSTAFAQNVKEPATGIEFVPQTGFGGKTLSLTGVAVRTRLGFKGYAIASYLESGSPVSQLLSDGPAKLIVMQFVRNVSADDVRKAFSEGIEKNVPNKTDPAIKAESDKFLNFFKSEVKPNDKIELFWTQGGNLAVRVKGQDLGKVQNAALAQGVWNIWLGSKSILSDDNKKRLTASAK